MNETPYCFLMLFADIIQRDSVGKWNILGAFDLLKPAAFPAEFTIGVFFGLSDGRGKMPIKIQVVEGDGNFEDGPAEVAGQITGEIELPNPLATVQATVAIPVKFDRPGTYHVELIADDVLILTRRLAVHGPVTEESQ